MNFGTIFLVLGAATTGLAFLFSSLIPSLICYYTAFSFFSMAVGFWLQRPRLWLKHPDGRMSALSNVMFGPARLLCWMSYESFRQSSRRNPFVQVIPGLYLGRRLIEHEALLLRDVNLAGVLDLTSEFSEPPFMRNAPAYLNIPVLDTMAPTFDQLAESVEFIQQQLPKGPVYVHCALGHGRSALVVMAYLITAGKCADAVEALTFVKSRRPGVSLMTSQWACLCTWERANKKKHE